MHRLQKRVNGPARAGAWPRKSWQICNDFRGNPSHGTAEKRDSTVQTRKNTEAHAGPHDSARPCLTSPAKAGSKPDLDGLGHHFTDVDGPCFWHRIHTQGWFGRDWLTNFVHILKQSATKDRRGKRVGDHQGSFTQWSSRLSEPRAGSRLEQDWLHGVVE